MTETMIENETMRTAEQNESEWAALERSAKTDGFWGPRGFLLLSEGWRNSGVRYSNTPHPDSYGAKLPMQSQTVAQLGKTNARERKQLAERPATVRMLGGTDDELAGRAVEKERNDIASRMNQLSNRPYSSWNYRELEKLRKLTTADIEARAERAVADILKHRARIKARSAELSLFLSY